MVLWKVKVGDFEDIWDIKIRVWRRNVFKLRVIVKWEESRLGEGVIVGVGVVSGGGGGVWSRVMLLVWLIEEKVDYYMKWNFRVR